MDEKFFEGVEQVELAYDGGTGRLPIFYRKARSFSLMLPASLAGLRKMLPDPRFSPAQALPGVGVILLSAFEYADTDIGPYNEFSVGVILNNPHFARIPCYNLARQYLARFYHVYIHFLPVTTEIALRAGVDYYGFPKIIADIDFEETSGSISCSVLDEGREVLRISCARVPTRNLGEMVNIANLYQFRQLQQAEFKVNVLAGSVRWLPPDASFRVDRSHPVGAAVAGAVLGTRALACLYMPEIQGILYGPERMTLGTTARGLDAMRR